jgi:heme/copper-type cytochrome/quinol oxidase subunit 3
VCLGCGDEGKKERTSVNTENKAKPVRNFLFLRSCVIFDGVVAAIFVGKGLYYALRPEIRGAGYSPQFLLAHLAVALLMVSGAVLVAKRKRGASAVQALIFLVIGTILLVTIFFNPANSP